MRIIKKLIITLFCVSFTYFVYSMQNDQNNVSELSLLMCSIEKGYIELTESLLYLGFNPNEQTKEGKTALMVAIKKENKEIIRILLKSGAKVNITDNEGKTALNIAQETKNNGILNIITLAYNMPELFSQI